MLVKFENNKTGIMVDMNIKPPIVGVPTFFFDRLNQDLELFLQFVF